MKKTKNITIDKQAKVSSGAIIYSNVCILGNSIIEEGVIIFSGSVIQNSKIGKNTIIKSSYIEDSEILENAVVGPFSHIRTQSKIGENSVIGNFVEVKNSIIGKGVKALHHSYIGDADVGDNTNIGCGVIFCNYNGKTKNRITIKNNCFIGSNSNLIAPLCIAEKTYIAAGSTLTKNTNEYDFVISRNRETIKPEFAKKYID